MTDLSDQDLFAKSPGRDRRERSQATGHPWGEILRKQSRFPLLGKSPGVGLDTLSQKLALPNKSQRKKANRLHCHLKIV